MRSFKTTEVNKITANFGKLLRKTLFGVKDMELLIARKRASQDGDFSIPLASTISGYLPTSKLPVDNGSRLKSWNSFQVNKTEVKVMGEDGQREKWGCRARAPTRGWTL